MSKGHGHWQRGLLAALEKYPALFLADLLQRPYPRSQYVALHRAAHKLADQGKVDIWHTGLAGGTNSMWVCRPGYECEHNQVPRIGNVTTTKVLDWARKC